MLLGQVLEARRESSVEYACRRGRCGLSMSLTEEHIAHFSLSPRIGIKTNIMAEGLELHDL